MGGGRKARSCEATTEEQEAFWRDNAVAIIRERDAQVGRLRREIARLEKARRALRQNLAKAECAREGLSGACRAALRCLEAAVEAGFDPDFKSAHPEIVAHALENHEVLNCLRRAVAGGG